MISKLIINNFKGIKQGELPLSPLTILVGTNNAGKSTILEALFLAPNPFRQVPYGGETAVSVVRKLHATLDSAGFAFLMNDYREKHASIKCEINGGKYSLEFHEEGGTIYLTSNKQRPNRWNAYVFGTRRIEAFGKLQVRNNDSDGHDSEPFIGDSFLVNHSLIEAGYDYLRRNWASVMNSGASRKVVKEVSELSPEKYSDLTLEPFIENTFALYAFREDGKRLRMGDLGEGIQTYVLARMLYELKQPELLLWDDIESHFNPRILVRLSEWFLQLVENGKQVVLATHSLEAIKLISEYNAKNTSILLTSLSNGTLSTRIISVDQIEEFKRAGIDVRIAESLLI